VYTFTDRKREERANAMDYEPKQQFLALFFFAR
jgi:hypothetical protein